MWRSDLRCLCERFNSICPKLRVRRCNSAGCMWRLTKPKPLIHGERQTTAWRNSVLGLRTNTAIGMVILACCFGPPFAPTSAITQAVEKTIPQGQDPPKNEDQPTAPPTEYKGVITPPPVGDEGIYTKVPNPEAGHEKEVIPPPGSPGGNPNVEPR
jgi:hypothetical protein